MRLVSNFNHLASTLVNLVVISLLVSCSEQRRTTVVNYPVNKAFVYNNKIEIAGLGSKDEKKQLTTELDNYWDDSIRIRSIQKFGFFYKMKQPALFEPLNLQRSISFMNAFLQTRGFYRASFSDSVRVDTVGDQLQTHIVAPPLRILSPVVLRYPALFVPRFFGISSLMTAVYFTILSQFCNFVFGLLPTDLGLDNDECPCLL